MADLGVIALGVTGVQFRGFRVVGMLSDQDSMRASILGFVLAIPVSAWADGQPTTTSYVGGFEAQITARGCVMHESRRLRIDVDPSGAVSWEGHFYNDSECSDAMSVPFACYVRGSGALLSKGKRLELNLVPEQAAPAPIVADHDLRVWECGPANVEVNLRKGHQPNGCRISGIYEDSQDVRINGEMCRIAGKESWKSYARLAATRTKTGDISVRAVSLRGKTVLVLAKLAEEHEAAKQEDQQPDEQAK